MSMLGKIAFGLGALAGLTTDYGRKASAKLKDIVSENFDLENFDAKEYLSERAKSYKNIERIKPWFDKNFSLFKRAFEDVKIRDFIFEPFRDVFNSNGDTEEQKIKSVITQVAVANMVLAGLPGKLGVGVFVSMGLEAWMALKIAGQVGIEIKKPSDIFKYFGLLSGIFLTITMIFKELLGFAFSIFSFIPFVSPLVIAELVVTDLVGILFWIGFLEARKEGSFKIPARAFLSLVKQTKDLFSHQKAILEGLINAENIKSVGKKMMAWFNGDIIVNKAGMRGEIFHVAAMVYLIQRKHESLSGPLGDVFIKSIKRSIPDLQDSSLEEISSFFAEKTPTQMNGYLNLVKGEMFEHLVEKYENNDGDNWSAKLHDDRTYPDSDVVFTNIKTGEEIEISLKSTDNMNYIEKALKKYPDTPIIATSEAEAHFGDNPFVDTSHFSDNEIETVTEENFERLVSQLEPLNTSEIVSGGVMAKAIGQLWPFVIAYIRKRISYENLEDAMVRVLGETGKSLASRIGYGILLGPVFAWYLLARGVITLTRGAESLAKKRILMQV